MARVGEIVAGSNKNQLELFHQKRNHSSEVREEEHNARRGISVPHLLAVVGPFMILPNVGLNEWGHAFWFMEEIFAAPLHWGFVILGWAGLALGGVLIQIVRRVNDLLPHVQNS